MNQVADDAVPEPVGRRNFWQVAALMASLLGTHQEYLCQASSHVNNGSSTPVPSAARLRNSRIGNWIMLFHHFCRAPL